MADVDWKGDPLPDHNEIKLNIVRLSGEIALNREKQRSSLSATLSEMREIAHDPDLRAAAGDLARVTGRSVDEIVNASIQPAIDDFTARIVAHDEQTANVPAPTGVTKRGSVTEAFFKNLGETNG